MPKTKTNRAVRPTTANGPTRRQILAIALLADVDVDVAELALREGSGAVGGIDGQRVAIALSSMRRDVGDLSGPPRMLACGCSRGSR